MTYLPHGRVISLVVKVRAKVWALQPDTFSEIDVRAPLLLTWVNCIIPISHILKMKITVLCTL